MNSVWGYFSGYFRALIQNTPIWLRKLAEDCLPTKVQ
jgi:hypothetical protein